MTEAATVAAHDRSRSALRAAARRLAQLAGRAGLYLMLSSGLLYFTYKFYQPQGGADYYKYYPIYLHPLDFHAGQSPYVYRQISAVLTNLIYRCGPYYHPQIAFLKPGYDQRVFFAAVLANYLALAACAVVSSVATERLAPRAPPSVALFAGALCYLGFFSQQCGMGPITDGVAWLMVGVGLLGYLGRSMIAVAIVAGLSIVERETIPLMLAAIATAELVMTRERRRFDLAVIALCAAALAIYWLLRTVWFPARGHEYQTQLAWMLAAFPQWRSWLNRDVLFQDFLSQNLLILLLVVASWRLLPLGRGRRAMSPQANRLMVGVFAATAALLVVCALTLTPGNTDIGRIAAMLTPAISALLAVTLFQDEGPSDRPNAPVAASS